MNEIFHLPQALGRGGDVLIAAGRALGGGDEDVAAPARRWGGDVFIGAGRALGWGDVDVAAPFHNGVLVLNLAPVTTP